MTDTHIKIKPVVPKVQYTGNGVTTVFPYTFAIFDDSDMVVYIGDEIVESGYTVTGKGQTDGGNVTFSTAPADGVKITLLRNVPIERVTDFQEGGTFRPKNINDELDRQTAFAQQIQEAISRCVKVPVTRNISPEQILLEVERIYYSIDNVDAVADDLTNINAIANDLTNLDAIATDLSNLDSIVPYLANIRACATDISNINSVSAKLTEINGVYDDLTQIEGVYGKLTQIEGVYNDLTNVDAVASDLANIDYLANNSQIILVNNATGNNGLSIKGAATTSNNSVSIGLNADASGNGSIAIGGGSDTNKYARATGEHSIAIGNAVGNNKGPLASGTKSIQIGPGENSTASTLSIGLDENNNYQLLNNKGEVPFDRLSQIMIQGDSAPSTSTAGFVSQLYRNTNAGKIYVCVGASGGVYSWQEVGTGGGGGSGAAEAYDCPAITSVGGVCTWTISHNMDSRDIQVSVYDTTNYTDAQCNITRPTANSVVVTFLSSSDITAGAYRVVLLASSAYGLAPCAIKDCSDVLLTSVANGDLLKYDSSAQKWENTKDLGSVTATTPATSDDSTKVATTEFVNNVLEASTTQKTIVGWGMPDYSSGVSIAIPKNIPYVADKNGYISAFISVGGGMTEYVYVNGQVVQESVGASIATTFPVSVGDSVTTTVSNGYFYFIPCKSEV